MMDKYTGKRAIRCWHSSAYYCDRCGGTGWRAECLRADCKEYGCGGYGSCYVTPEQVAAGVVREER